MWGKEEEGGVSVKEREMSDRESGSEKRVEKRVTNRGNMWENGFFFIFYFKKRKMVECVK